MKLPALHPGQTAFIVTEWNIKAGAVTNHYAKWFKDIDTAKEWAKLESNNEYIYTVKIESYQ